MLSLAYMLFVLIISQPSADYPIARFVFLLLRYVHEKKFEKKLLLLLVFVSCTIVGV